MKSVRNANYIQKDHKAEVTEVKGVEILPIRQGIEKYEWAKKYFDETLKEGYFIWIKKKLDFPLATCISIVSKDIKQDLKNLIIIEKGLEVELKGVCNSLGGVCGEHFAQGKIILREGASLKYEHIHSWNQKDVTDINYEFLLGKNSKLDYTYKIFSTPEELKIKTKVFCSENSAANLKVLGDSRNSKIKIEDRLILNGEKSSGILKLRLVGRKNSKISTDSQILAEAESKGHLDCQGLLIDKNSELSLTPELICKNKQAQVTHEASIGKISGEELYYLMSRGLNEQEAIDLIVNGFLE